MALIDDYKNGKRYGTDWKAPSIQHMNDLVGTVVNADDKSSEAISDSATAVEQSSQALSTANAANTKSDNAVSTSNAANTKSDQAVLDATQAKTNAQEALSKSTTAESNSENALQKATVAESNSTNALNKASTAEANSNAAVITANGAEATANGIDGKAQQALDNSTSALDKATEALTQVTQSQGSKVYDTLGNLLSVARIMGDDGITVSMSEDDPNAFKISLSEETMQILNEILTKCNNIENRVNIMLPYQVSIVEEFAPAAYTTTGEKINGTTYYVVTKLINSAYKSIFELDPVVTSKLFEIINNLSSKPSIIAKSIVTTGKNNRATGAATLDLSFSGESALYIPYENLYTDRLTNGTYSTKVNGFIKLIVNKDTQTCQYSILTNEDISSTSDWGYISEYKLIAVEFYSES